MAYGLYIYKNLPNKIRLEVHRKDWSNPAIEIKAMGVTPLSLIGLDNSGADVRVPIIKSSVNIEIKDLGEIDYKEFFTADATKFKVLIKENGSQVWGGYITPDSYSQSYEYRTSIKLVARDNLGLLDQLDYDWFEYDFVTPIQLIEKAQELINWCMTPIYWYAQQYRSGDTQISDACLNVELFREKTWWEVLELVLSSLGQQMRYVGNNKVFICNVADLYQLGTFGLTGEITHSISNAAEMEVIPSWRELEIKQDYGTIKELLNYNQKYTEWSFVKSATNGARHSLYKNSYFKESNNGILFYANVNYSNATEDNSAYYNTFLINFRESLGFVYKDFNVASYKNGFEVKISVYNYLAQVNTIQSQGGIRLIKPYYYRGGNEWQPPVIKIRLSIQLLTEAGGILYLDENDWSVTEKIIEFSAEEHKPTQQGDTLLWNDELKTFTINISNLPQSEGSLRVCIHNPVVSGNHLSDAISGYADTVIIKDLQVRTVPNEISGTSYKGFINKDGNVKENIDISVGEVPVNSGDSLAYAGGLFDSTKYRKALTSWHRYDDKGGVRPLSELIGRGYAHHFVAFKNINDEKTGGKIITATITFDKTQDFAKRYTVNGEEFIVNSGTYDMISKQANVTLRQVLPYDHAGGEFTENAVSAGGGSIIGGGGNNEVVTWSASGGGGGGTTKRVYELSTETNLDNAYLLVDTPGAETAKKIPSKTYALEAHTHDDRYAKKNGDQLEDFATKNLDVKGIATFGDAIVMTNATGGGGADLPEGNLNEILYYNGSEWVGKHKDTFGFLTDGALVGYATQAWVIERIPNIPAWAMQPNKPSYGWTEIVNKPITFTPSAHNQAIDTITGLQGVLDNKLAKSIWDAEFTVTATGLVHKRTAIFNGMIAMTNATGGGGGTSDYNELENLPFIGGIKVSGSKTLVDYGLMNHGLATQDWVNTRIPNVYAWALQAVKPSYAWTEITGKPTTWDWSLISNKPNSFTPSDHNHTWLRKQDTRGSNLTPAQFYSSNNLSGIELHFKANGVDGLTDGGAFHGNLLVAPYQDSTGGPMYQLGFTPNNNLWMRKGNTTSWDNWVKFYHSDNLAPASEAIVANTLAQRDVNGFLNAKIFRDEWGIDNSPIGTVVFKINSADGYHRNCTPDHFKAQLGLWSTSNFNGVGAVTVRGSISNSELPNASMASLQNGIYQIVYGGYSGMLVSLSAGGSTNPLQFLLDHYQNNSLKWRSGVDGNRFSNANFRTLWDSGNSNLATVDWSMRNATIAGTATANGFRVKDDNGIWQGNKYTSGLRDIDVTIVSVTGNVILYPYSGNVGIGTYNPTAKLHVNGNQTVEGTAIFKGAIIMNNY